MPRTPDNVEQPEIAGVQPARVSPEAAIQPAPPAPPAQAHLSFAKEQPRRAERLLGQEMRAMATAMPRQPEPQR